MRKIALINQKGGVGKTTTAVNLAAALAEAGRRVVVVDLDPQANLTLHFGCQLEANAATSYRVLVGECGFAESLHETHTPGLFVVPTDIDLSGAELELASAFGRESLLRDAVESWEKEHRAAHGEEPADYLIFDCPPSLGLIAVNGLTASSEVFLAVQTEFFALQGLSKLVDIVELVTSRLNPSLRLTGLVACLYDSRLRLAREVLGELRNFFPEQIFRQVIGTNVKLAEAPSFGQTILQYAPESAGARDYRGLAQEVLAMESAAQAEAQLEPQPRQVPTPSPASEELGQSSSHAEELPELPEDLIEESSPANRITPSSAGTSAP